MSSANRSDLVSFIQEDLECTKVDARRILDSVLEGIAQAIETHPRVIFSDFGVFRTYIRPPLRRYDPTSGKVRTIPPARRIKFDPSPALMRRAEKCPVDEDE